jgi:hypothetical protein
LFVFRIFVRPLFVFRFHGNQRKSQLTPHKKVALQQVLQFVLKERSLAVTELPLASLIWDGVAWQRSVSDTSGLLIFKQQSDALRTCIQSAKLASSSRIVVLR